MSTLTVSHTLTPLHGKSTSALRLGISPRRAVGMILPLGTVLGMFALFGGFSLGLANATLSLQEERAKLRLEIQETRSGLDALNAALAERQDPAALKTAAEALGLVPEGDVVFIDEATSHLTCGESCRTTRQ